MSVLFVPGRILLVDSSSGGPPRSSSDVTPEPSLTVGDLGPIWTSVNGGGLGSRGELDGEAPDVAI
jgi:hypothetical protein